MRFGINWLALILLFVVLAIIVGTPVFLLVAGIKRHKRTRSIGAKVMIGSGITICLLYVFAIASHVMAVGPYRSGILSHGVSPSGHEYCVVQTYKALGLIGEPYQVSFCLRDADGAWRWQYLAHQDDAWRDVRVSFSGDKAQVYHKGYSARELQVPTGGVNRLTMREGERYLPASYSVDDVLKWHNTKFKD